MSTYYISIRSTGNKYGYAIRDGRNSTVCHGSPKWTMAEAERRALARAEQLVDDDRLLGKRSCIGGES